MAARQELLDLLKDTERWASDPAYFDTDSIYSSWPTHSALLAELASHIADASKGVADFFKLYALYGPTAGLSEVVRPGEPTANYMKLAERFDLWYAGVKPN